MGLGPPLTAHPASALPQPPPQHPEPHLTSAPWVSCSSSPSESDSTGGRTELPLVYLHENWRGEAVWGVFVIPFVAWAQASCISSLPCWWISPPFKAIPSLHCRWLLRQIYPRVQQIVFKPIPKVCRVCLFTCSRGGEFVDLQLLPNHKAQKPQPKISRSHLGEAASGVLLIYSQSILHILEASSGTLYHILMDLALFEQQGAIMVMSHNIPTRLFSQWNATKLEVPVTLEDVTQSQTTEEVITECLTLILKMGVYLATLKVRMGNKDLGECLHTAVPELLIPAETIQYLCRSQECLSPAEFLKMYKKPLQPQMDSASF
uniref:Testis expressed 47 n=1 Tax=Pseudonaja textilis TaxID=8673 RepID=A0A670XTY9_PSETE